MFSKWTLVVFLVFVCPLINSRPSQETVTISVGPSSVTTETQNRSNVEKSTQSTPSSSSAAQTNSPRDVKTKVPILGDSIKLVANQLLQNLSNSSESSIVSDTRIPPKLKTQLAHKHSIKTRHEDAETENSHAGVAVPVTFEELESENKISDTTNESSTTHDGISTWILLSNPTNKDNSMISSTEATKPEATTKKSKPVNKNKTKRPQLNSNKTKRPIIGSTNKSDLIAGGSAINENVFNKIKATVLSNVQKNKNASNKSAVTTTTTTTTSTTTTPAVTTLKEVSTKPPTTVSVAKISSKSSKKKNKNKHKVSTTLAPAISDSALLPMEPKVQEIELEISTPATTTKKPKRSSTKKKKKNKTKNKTSKPVADNEVSETKVSNKTKSAKPSTKKPAAKNPVAKNPVSKNPITTQLYNYLSREVMPSVGVGIVGLAGLVGLAGYFLYPFSTPVRRTFEVDKKDDLYRNNAEEYASEGNGQAEEEMLGTVLAGMPAHAKNKFNPYLAQTSNRYPAKKEKENQNIRYRQVASNSYDTSSYNTPYQQNYQQKTGIAHGAVYAEPIKYNQYETRHAYSAENKYPYEPKNAYTYAAVEPIYAAPQTGPAAVVTSYGNEAPQSVVYGVSPTQDTEFKPVYPYEGKVYSETTSQPSYPSTSMYLGSNNESEIGDESEVKYDENGNSDVDNKFVVGNVPKEFSDNVTPAIVPEHGPRNLSRKRRNIVGSIEDILKAAKSGRHDELSNEIDEALGITRINTDVQQFTTESNPMAETVTFKPADKNEKEGKATIFPIYAVSVDDTKKDSVTTFKDEIVESISTLPIQSGNDENLTTDSGISNEVEDTTKPFRVYEIFTTVNSAITNEEQREISTDVMDSTTEGAKENTETTTDTKSDTTTIAPSMSPNGETKGPTEPTFTTTKRPTFDTNIITYPPYNEEGSFFTFIKRLLEFKYRLGLSILQTTSESLNRYLRSMESTVNNMAKASKYQ